MIKNKENQKQYRISLLFNANKIYDRQIIEGIGHYLQSTKVNWDVYLEEDCLARLNNLNDWDVDGIIADFDDPEIRSALRDISVPIIAVGSSYSNVNDYPKQPYVATDNEAIVEEAFRHLRQKGLQKFGFYGFPPDNSHRWAIEREKALQAVCAREGFTCLVYRGYETRVDTWQKNMNRLTEWISSLPIPCGVVSVTDARARHLLQACTNAGRLVPDQVAIVGIDDDDIARNLSRVSLSSVSQGCFDMGFKAARLLHQRMVNPPFSSLPRILVPPKGVVERQSTDFKALQDPYVIQAMHFVRLNACKGIKVDQVLDYVGISRSNLEQRFKQECGVSIHSQIHQHKLETAITLLKNRDRPFSEVASTSGYPSLQYMHAIIKKHFDMTPKQLREHLSIQTDVNAENVV